MDNSISPAAPETLFFDDIVDRASKRIGIYREKLQIDLSKK